MSDGSTASRAHSVNTWCLRSVDMVHDVADSNSTVPQFRYRTVLGIEICNADCTSGNWRLVDRSQ